MKEFNLDKAVAGEPLVTRDGRKVAEFHHFITDGSKFPCVAMVSGAATWVTLQGRDVGPGRDSANDLFMAPKMVTKYLNVYDSRAHGSYDGQSSFLFDNEEAAKDNADRNAVKVIVRAMPIQWEEA
jgi:hypothetical protein